MAALEAAIQPSYIPLLNDLSLDGRVKPGHDESNGFSYRAITRGQ
jgi:hypothetical protein